MKNKNVLLHFGAVDWKADIWVNDVKVGSHTGGLTPFSFDIKMCIRDRKTDMFLFMLMVHIHLTNVIH